LSIESLRFLGQFLPSEAIDDCRDLFRNHGVCIIHAKDETYAKGEKQKRKKSKSGKKKKSEKNNKEKMVEEAHLVTSDASHKSPANEPNQRILEDDQ
jgi:hypothetical protein